MSQANFSFFNHTFEKTNRWLLDVRSELPLVNNYQAFIALKATLKALRDRLTHEEAVQLSSQLPVLLRGYYFEGWKISQTPSSDKDISEFLERFKKHLGKSDLEDPYLLFKTCLKVISKRISAGEIEDIRNSMPKKLKQIWKTL